jgi:hypothetical protein
MCEERVVTEFRWFRATRQLWKVRGAVGAGFVTIAALGGSLAEWLIAVRGMDRCPNCGARDDDSPLI